MSSERHKPEEKYLRKKLAELAEIESLLAQRELELHTLRGGLLAFEHKYESAVGAKVAELDELRARIAELSPPTSNMRDETGAAASTARGVAKTQASTERASRGKRRSRRKDANAKPATPALAPAPKPSSDFLPAKTLKQLYRDIAKALHPDLADDDDSRANRHDFMIRANVAYEAGDEATLRAVFQEWEHAPESVSGRGAGADLVRAIRKIERAELRLVAIAREMEQLQGSGLFGMKMMSDEAVQFERDLLREMTGRLDGEIAAARDLLARLESAAPSNAAQPEQLPQAPSEPAAG